MNGSQGTCDRLCYGLRAILVWPCVPLKSNYRTYNSKLENFPK
jgi:hypothetical protein